MPCCPAISLVSVCHAWWCDLRVRNWVCNSPSAMPQESSEEDDDEEEEVVPTGKPAAKAKPAPAAAAKARANGAAMPMQADDDDEVWFVTHCAHVRNQVWNISCALLVSSGHRMTRLRRRNQTRMRKRSPSRPPSPLQQPRAPQQPRSRQLLWQRKTRQRKRIQTRMRRRLELLTSLLPIPRIKRNTVFIMLDN